MRRFSSYGPIDTEVYYYAPRKELIEKGYTQFIGENPGKGGHYFTVWAPRQTGKSWLMKEILFLLKKESRFHSFVFNLEAYKYETDAIRLMNRLASGIGEKLGKNVPEITHPDQFQDVFKNDTLDKPLILILDEFDALEESIINALVSSFRSMYNVRQYEMEKTTEKKTYLLHSVALIGVRSVLGIENPKGSPFNVQRSLHIPNLTFDEVRGMFEWYEKESGQHIDPGVIERLYKETNGQPGLTCWFGELMTEGFKFYKNDLTKPITMTEFEKVYAGATYALPNNNIMNLISKAKEKENKTLLLKMFQTEEKIPFKFDNETMNAMYMNGLVEPEFEDGQKYYMKFPSPFVQKRLFNYFSDVYFEDLGALLEEFTDLDNIITPTDLDIIELLKLYQHYLEKNKGWLFKKVPRRSDHRPFEAVFHFSFYSYFSEFLRSKKVSVFPEFPTGNGKIDIVFQYGEKQYGVELKSFRDNTAFRNALVKAAYYGKQLGLMEIFLVSFIESMDEETRSTLEKPSTDPVTGVTVKPFFILTGRV